MDDSLFAIIEAMREADETGGLLTDAELIPVTIDDGEGGVFQVYRDGSYCLRVDGRLA